ncbi:MAG: hypothetical protein JW955_19695 [Sedimentisphaerales bacterium]|nr:hypothetical protein [Sedimentisphaerales bacterium]
MVVLSTGQIAEEIGQDRDRVSYAIRKAGIKPIGRAGLVRLFPQSAVGKVQEFLKSRQAKENPHATTDPNAASPSRQDLLVRAAEVLLVLQFPLARTERTALLRLFDRRLRRVYNEVTP